jgi:hypothetical protein
MLAAIRRASSRALKYEAQAESRITFWKTVRVDRRRSGIRKPAMNPTANSDAAPCDKPG